MMILIHLVIDQSVFLVTDQHILILPIGKVVLIHFQFTTSNYWSLLGGLAI